MWFATTLSITQEILKDLGFLLFLAFGACASSLFLLWIYLVLGITGRLYAGSPRRDAKAKQLAIFVGKIFLLTLAAAVVLIVIIHLIGPSPQISSNSATASPRSAAAGCATGASA